MKRQFNRALSIAFAIVFLSAVCTTMYAEESDTWIVVNRTNQLAGNWEGSVAYDIPAIEEAMSPAGSMDVTISFWYTEGADEFEFEVKMDFYRYIAAWSDSVGLSPSTLWEFIGLMFRQDEDIGPEFELGEYVMYYTQVLPVGETLDNGAMLINTSSNKLKFTESSIVGIDNFPISDFIMYRK
jgi:hypothetical protein